MDIAQESESFEVFKVEVERFFNDPDADDADERLWNDALREIRTNNLTPLDEFSKLPRESVESKPTQITVERLDRQDRRFLPSDNVADTYSVPLAA